MPNIKLVIPNHLTRNFAQGFCDMAQNCNTATNNKMGVDADATSLAAQYKLDLQDYWQAVILDKDTGNNADKYAGDAAKMNGALGFVQSLVDMQNTNTQNDAQNLSQIFSLGQSVLGIASDVSAILHSY